MTDSSVALLAKAIEAVVDGLVDRIRLELAQAVENQPQPPALLTIDLLCHELQCSRATVNRMRAEGMPSVMVGDSPRFVLARVLAWLEARS